MGTVERVEDCHKRLKVADKIRKIAKWTILGTGAIAITSGILIGNKLEDLREDMLEDVGNKEIMTEFNAYLAEKNSDKYLSIENGYWSDAEYLDAIAEPEDYTTEFVGFCSQSEDEAVRNRVAKYAGQKEVYDTADRLINTLGMGFLSAGLIGYIGSKSMRKQAKNELFELLYDKEDSNDMEYDFR